MTNFEMIVISLGFLMEFLGFAFGLVLLYVNVTNKQTQHETEIQHLKHQHVEFKDDIKGSIDEIKQDLKEIMKNFRHQ